MIFVLGTHNAKKLYELRMLLLPQGLELKSLADFPRPFPVEESGDSFADNARRKAAGQATHLGHWVIGEDSGLSVDALDGAPGVYSARFAGVDATDRDNNQLLLEKLRGVPDKRRTAIYTCHLCVSNPAGQIVLDCEDHCRGRIAHEPRGSCGFGYDPLFLVPEYHATFGQLGDAVKSVLSHRARAIRALVPRLLKLAENTA